MMKSRFLMGSTIALIATLGQGAVQAQNDAPADVEARASTQSNGNAPRETVRRDNIRATPRTDIQNPQRPEGASGEPDVFLDISELSVEEITLEVANLKAHLALDARVANLVTLTAGVDASVDNVKLSIKGVKAKAQLRVHLDNVAYILDRTLTTIDRNPQILDRVLSTVDNTVNTVGSVANTALAPGGVLSQTVNTLGQTVQRTLDTTGNLVERTLDTTGSLVSSRSLGRLLDLPVLSQTTNAAGQVVKRVRDSSGKVIEYSLDSAGKVVNARVLNNATGKVNNTVENATR